jgi:hypothetical protein
MERYNDFDRIRGTLAGHVELDSLVNPFWSHISFVLNHLKNLQEHGYDGMSAATFIEHVKQVSECADNILTETAWVLAPGGTCTPILVQRPNLSKWDKVDRFTLWDAAWLWADHEPRPQGQVMTSESERAFRDLEAAIERDQLRVIRENLRDVIAAAYDRHARGRVQKADPNWVAERRELISCAHSLGVKPPFLFPRERT